MTRPRERWTDLIAQWWTPHTRSGRPTERDGGVRLRLVLQRGDERLHVGTLRVKDEQYVFTYSDAYRRTGLPALPEFPSFDKPHEFDRLPTFFEVRVPPVTRPDIASLLAAEGIKPTDVLRILGKLGSTSPTSPFEFELRAA